METLVVPIRLDAKLVTAVEFAAEAKADFTRLPYNDGREDVNSEYAYISENFLSVPFQNRNFLLRPGVHLHWALPDALTAGEIVDHGAAGKHMTHPPVPDRWLVTRTKKDDKGESISKSWVVESNYLHPEGRPNGYNAIAYPFEKEGSGMPFRYMGRAYEYYEFKIDAGGGKKDEKRIAAPPDNGTYLPGLTAVGYGEPTFAAFYPNCHSVFGFVDMETKTDDDARGTSYEVVGWYSDPINDPLVKIQNSSPGADFDQLNKVLGKDYKWKAQKYANTGIPPEATIVYAQLSFGTGTFTTCIPDFQSQDHAVAIGNTGTEALSAWLANYIANQGPTPANQALFEEQLEAIQLRGKLAGRLLDIGPAFDEAYHEKGFSTESGTGLWSLQMESVLPTENGAAGANQNEAGGNSGVTTALPELFAHQLNALNVQQQLLDQASYELADLQQQLYADWYKYMIAGYHPDIAQGMPEADEIRFFIENNGLINITGKKRLIADLQSEIGKLKSEINNSVDLFNHAGNEGKRILEKKFDSRDIETFKLSDSPGISSMSNDSFTAVSFVVRINSSQPADDGVLIALKDLQGTTLGMNGDSYRWKLIYVDGRPLNSHLRAEWTDFPKDRWIHVYLQASEAVPLSSSVMLMSNLQGSLAALRIFKAGLTEEELFFDQNMMLLKKLKLSLIAGPRYWTPNDPVVLIAGPVATPSLRYGFDGAETADGLLKCLSYAFSGYERSPVDKTISALLKQSTEPFRTSFSSFFSASLGISKNPWNPLILEWKAGVAPLSIDSSPDYTGGRGSAGEIFQIPEDFLLNAFKIAADQPELLPVNPSDLKTDPLRIYSGATFLTPHAKDKMMDVLEKYLSDMHEDDPDWLAFTQGSPNAGIVLPTAGNIVQWIRDAVKKINGTTDPVSTAVRAHEALKNGHFLSQSLGGFNAALLMKHQTMQLPIADPIGFDESREFTKRIRDAVDREGKFAPAPLNEFDPIRTGRLDPIEVNIIDSFGQVMQVYPRVDDMGDTAAPASGAETPVHFSRMMPGGYLPPRIVQPTRVSFRWLSAGYDDLEMNDHPASSPVCGWLVPNNIDESIMVYDQDGYALGAVADAGPENGNAFSNGAAANSWKPAPGYADPILVPEIANPHLRKVVENLLRTPLFGSFIELLDDTLNQIDPESFAQHLDLAMLMGRPMAVVRASVNIELKGIPAINQSWDFFNFDLERDPAEGNIRETNSWEKVKFPVRIGEHGQLNDGVVGYWLDSDPTRTFCSVIPESDSTLRDPAAFLVRPYRESSPNIALSIADKAVTMTMLLDPRGKVHATSGVLPAKIISLPADQFTPALKGMSVTFFTRPVLSPLGKVALPLPDEPGYTWSWLCRKGGKWREISTAGVVHKETFLEAFADGAEIWNELVTKGWILETGNNKAGVVLQNRRKDPVPGPVLLSQESRITEILDKGHILGVDSTAHFSQGQEILEGWLKLTPKN